MCIWGGLWKMNKFRLGFVVVGMATFMAVWFVVAPDQSIEQPVVYLERGDIIETISERGILISTEKQKIYAQVQGQVQHILAKLGQDVTSNQAVLLIDSSTISHQLHQKVIEWKSLSEEQRHLKQELEQKRYLVDQQIISEKEFKSYELLHKKHDLSVEAISEEIIFLKNQKKKHDVLSKVGGVVSSIYVTEGQLVQPGTLLMTVESPTSLVVDVSIREYEAHKVKLGQLVWISSPAFQNSVLRGEVTLRVPVIDQGENRQGMRVHITIHEDISRFNIFPGQAVDLDIVLSHSTQTWFLPITAVHYESGKPYVLLENGKVRRHVVVGARDQQRIEIVRGLSRDEGVVHAVID